MSTTAELIAYAIAEDIRGRYGLGDEWDACNQDIKNEIIGTWIKEINKILGRLPERTIGPVC